MVFPFIGDRCASDLISHRYPLCSIWEGLNFELVDDIFYVLDAYCHPRILMGRYALLWMGAAVIQDPVSTQSSIVFQCSN